MSSLRPDMPGKWEYVSDDEISNTVSTVLVLLLPGL